MCWFSSSNFAPARAMAGSSWSFIDMSTRQSPNSWWWWYTEYQGSNHHVCFNESKIALDCSFTKDIDAWSLGEIFPRRGKKSTNQTGNTGCWWSIPRNYNWQYMPLASGNMNMLIERQISDEQKALQFALSRTISRKIATIPYKPIFLFDNSTPGYCLICEDFENYTLITRIDLLCERIPSNSLLPDFSPSVIECAYVEWNTWEASVLSDCCTGICTSKLVIKRSLWWLNRAWYKSRMKVPDYWNQLCDMTAWAHQ